MPNSPALRKIQSVSFSVVHSSRHVPRVSPRHVILSSLAFVVVSAVVVWLSVSWAAAFIWFLLGYFIVVVRTLATPAADVVDTCVCADF